jgi:protein-tyrosine kinase
MSRIHEALKRAELERANERAAAANHALPGPPEIAGVSKAVHSETAAVSRESKPAGAANHPAVQFRFEDLVARRQPHADWKPDPDMDVFSGSQSSHGAEQFRTLRSRLYHLRNGRPLKTLLVTSSMAGEGKTFVTGNLVRSMVRQPERRVLVIDADLRRPRLHLVFGSPTAPGLSDYLRGTHDESAVIQFGGTGNLCLIPSGTRVNNPSELLSNGRMKTLFERLGPAFDWIVIDSPPCLPVADSGVIANWCDGLLLVVRAGFTPSALIAKVRQELKGRNVVGVVLNAVAEDSLAYGPYYGGYQASATKAAK